MSGENTAFLDWLDFVGADEETSEVLVQHQQPMNARGDLLRSSTYLLYGEKADVNIDSMAMVKLAGGAGALSFRNFSWQLCSCTTSKKKKKVLLKKIHFFVLLFERRDADTPHRNLYYSL